MGIVQHIIALSMTLDQLDESHVWILVGLATIVSTQYTDTDA